MKKYFYRLLLMVIACGSTQVYGVEDESALAKAALNSLKINHYAEHIAIPFQEYFNYANHSTQSILYFKPVLPFKLTPNFDLIVRTIAPLYEQTSTLNGQQIQGFGDINPTFFISPSKFKSVIVGLGPTISIPTATNQTYIGTGKWSIGPELAMYLIEKNWVAGFLTNNLWSVAGNPQKPAVNTFEFEYLISYVFDKGWYISSNPTITANWKSAPDQQWTVPFGLGAGRVIKIGQQSINLGIAGNYNLIRPHGLGPTWQLQLQIEWLMNTPSGWVA